MLKHVQRLLLAFVLLFCMCCTPVATNGVSGHRLLQQRKKEDIRITVANVDRLARLVEEASEDTTFVFASDVQLPSLIVVKTNRLTFRGTEGDSPALDCADREGGFMIQSDKAVFDSLILRNCSQTAITVADDAEQCSPFDPECIQNEEPQRLRIKIRNVLFAQNSESNEQRTAGAIAAGKKTSAEVSVCRFENNVGIRGGAISFSGVSLHVEDSVFIENTAENTGGAIRAAAEASGNVKTNVVIRNCNFTDNNVLKGSTDPGGHTQSRRVDVEPNPYLHLPPPSPSGGALYIADFSNVTIERCGFVGNRAVPAGGAVHIDDNTLIRIDDCRFEDNFVLAPQTSKSATDLQMGGALFVSLSDPSTELVVVSSMFINNSAAYGGGLHFVGPSTSRFLVHRCQFVRNVATVGGGAATLRNAENPIVSESRFFDNAAFVGGAILVTNGGSLQLSQANEDIRATLFEKNVAYDGGAVFGIGGGALRVLKVYFKRNKAERNGGAVSYVHASPGGFLEIQDARMFNNSAEVGGAIYTENVAKFQLDAGPVDRTAEILNRSDGPPRNEFTDNSAVAGGAIFYRASNLAENQFTGDRVLFQRNRVYSARHLIYDAPLHIPKASQETTALFQMHDVTNEDSGGMLLDPHGTDPCHPGGGGAMCVVLSGASSRASVSFVMTRSNFTHNSARVGGAMVVSSEEGFKWQTRCPSSKDPATSLLTGEPCKGFRLRMVHFEGNNAKAAGGAILASNMKHMHYSSDDVESLDTSYRTLDKVANGDHFIRNRVGATGYGPNVAGTAVRLNIRHPLADSETALLLANQSSGQSNPLPPIEIEVLDGLDQVINNGIVDSKLPVRVDSYFPGKRTPVASGELLSAAKQGVALFVAVSLTAPPGEYKLTFSVLGEGIKNATGNVLLRECFLGERYNSEKSICEDCSFETFTFYTNVSSCLKCPEHARCAGNASVTPISGYWHSSAFSVIMHECFHGDACDYDNRTLRLEEWREQHLPDFMSRFDEDTSPIFRNEEYPQCAPGYQGPLCGSCKKGYGRVDDKSCIECASRNTIVALVFVLGIWQLCFLAVTVRSALVSIRDMNQMVAIAQKQVVYAAARSKKSFGLRSASAFLGLNTTLSSSRQNSPFSRPPDLTESVERNGAEGTNQMVDSRLPGSGSPSTPMQQRSADCIVAAQHVSETIKILVNFFQITSVAVNINLDWTPSVKNMLAGMNFIAGFSDSAKFAPVTCLLSATSSERSIHGVVIRLMFPLCLMALVMCAFAMQWWWTERRSLGNGASQSSRQFFRSRTIICFLVVGFFAYQSVSEDLMGIVSCIKLDIETLSDATEHDDLPKGIDYSKFSIARGWYWAEDTNIQCFADSHAYLVGFIGIPGMALFLGGVPLYLLVFLLYRRQKNQLMDLDVLNTYGFIYQNYEDTFVYWEVCILFRKALISAIVVFAYPLGANLQGILALGVLIAALALHLMARPFKFLLLNVLEGSSLVVSIFTVFSGVVCNDRNTSIFAEVLLSVILVFNNSLLVIAFLTTIYIHGDRYVAAKLMLLGAVDIPTNPFSRTMLLISLLSERVTVRVASTMRQSLGKRSAQGSASSVSASGDMRSVSIAEEEGSSAKRPPSPVGDVVVAVRVPNSDPESLHENNDAENE